MARIAPKCFRCERRMTCTGGDIWYCGGKNCGVGQLRESEIVLERQAKALKDSGLTRDELDLAMQPLLSFHERETGEEYRPMYTWNDPW